jgi:hypothetical protein
MVRQRAILIRQYGLVFLSYQPVARERPESLFGFYAGTMSSHNVIKKMILINATELDHETIPDARRCLRHGILHRYGLRRRKLNWCNRMANIIMRWAWLSDDGWYPETMVPNGMI